MVLHRPVELAAETGQVEFYFTSPVTRLHVQVPSVLKQDGAKQSERILSISVPKLEYASVLTSVT